MNIRTSLIAPSLTSLLLAACGAADDSASFGQMASSTREESAESEETAEENVPTPDVEAPPTAVADSDDTSPEGASLGAPALCGSAAECPAGITCVKTNDADAFGFCDVSETSVSPDETEAASGDEAQAIEPEQPSTGVSLGAPAPCASDAECPAGITCVKTNDTDAFGFCDVSEVSVTP